MSDPQESRTRLTVIAAVAHGGVIGSSTGAGRRGMLWHLPEDLAFYRRTTMGHPQIMGRATFEAMGGALPGRRTIVVTRQPDWTHASVEVAHSLAEAIALAGPAEEIFVAGGGEIYGQALPLAHRLLITEVDRDVEGDVLFPAIEAAEWQEVDRTPGEEVSWVTYERR